MQAQEIFNIVVKHLLTQNEKSKNSESCLYRGPNNLKCAVGCLIPDADYHPWMENTGVVYRLVKDFRFPLHLSWMRNHLSLLHSLQNIHDNYLVSQWEIKLKRLAKELNLTMPEVF